MTQNNADMPELKQKCEKFFDDWFGPAFGPPEHLERIAARHAKSRAEFADRLVLFIKDNTRSPSPVAEGDVSEWDENTAKTDIVDIALEAFWCKTKENTDERLLADEAIKLRNQELKSLSAPLPEKGDDRLNRAYTERAIACVLLSKTAIALGYKAGVGTDNNTDWEDQWRVVLYIALPHGQISWHIAPEDQHLLDGLPTYEGKWDGTFNSRSAEFALSPLFAAVKTLEGDK